MTVSLTVETAQSEVQELRVSADYRREVQSIIVKAFAEGGSASAPAAEVAEQQIVVVEVRKKKGDGVERERSDGRVGHTLELHITNTLSINSRFVWSPSLTTSLDHVPSCDRATVQAMGRFRSSSRAE